MIHISVRGLSVAVLTFLVALSLPVCNKAQAAGKADAVYRRRIGPAPSRHLRPRIDAMAVRMIPLVFRSL